MRTAPTSAASEKGLMPNLVAKPTSDTAKVLRLSGERNGARATERLRQAGEHQLRVRWLKRVQLHTDRIRSLGVRTRARPRRGHGKGRAIASSQEARPVLRRRRTTMKLLLLLCSVIVVAGAFLIGRSTASGAGSATNRVLVARVGDTIRVPATATRCVV